MNNPTNMNTSEVEKKPAFLSHRPQLLFIHGQLPALTLKVSMYAHMDEKKFNDELDSPKFYA